MADISFDKSLEERPTLPPAPEVRVEFRDIARETPLQELRNNVELCIRQATSPIKDEMVKCFEEIKESDKQLRQDGKYHEFHRKTLEVVSRSDRLIGKAEGYEAALIQAVMGVIAEELRGKQ
jgi:hypothetical protein